jgi:hypothetical protein
MAEKTHMGMKVLGILGVIGGILLIIAGVLFAQLGTMMAEEAEQGEGLEGIVSLIPLISVGVTLTAIALPMIIMGLCGIVLSIFIYKERTWAYTLLFILAIMTLIVSIIGYNIWGIFISGVIVLYCWMIKDDFFGSKSEKGAEYFEK